MIYRIYVHHYYTKSLFYKLAHNTKNRIFNIKDNVGTVFCSYKNIKFEFIFNPEINDNTDGHHLLDFLTILSQLNKDKKYSQIDCINKKKGDDAHRGKSGAEWGVNDVPIMKWIADTLQNKKNWFICLFRTEKSFIKYDGIKFPPIQDLEVQIDRLKHHKLISDNCFINNTIESEYPNHKFALTNTIYEWNDLLSIRWYYEYKNIFEKLNPPYDLGFSIRYHKRHRIDILNKLANLNDNRIFLSRVDNCKNTEFFKYKSFNSNINFNITEGEDFADLTYIENIEHYLDYIMRILPMAKLHIVSETWDWLMGDITSNYLSEKTYGLILANIPFITIHPYPLELISKILNVRKHPFYDDIKNIKSDADKFIEFIKKFMSDYNNNYELCKNWVNEVHNSLMNELNSKNSFLDLVISNNFTNLTNSNKNLI